MPVQTISFQNNLKIAQIANALFGAVVGKTTNDAVLADIATVGASPSVGAAAAFGTTMSIYYTFSFAGQTTASVAAKIAANLGITATSVGSAANVTAATDFITAGLNTNAGAEGAWVSNFLLSFSRLTSNATYGAAATAWNTTIANAQAYTSSGAIADVGISGATAGATYTLTTGVENMTGTSGADTFNAYILNNANTLQSGDVLNGGDGSDTLFADIGNSQGFAITAQTTSIETVKIRAEAVAIDSANNNLTPAGQISTATNGSQVQIDAQRMSGVTQWESNNSRADVIIEDVRITPGNATKTVTIAMVETDPGNVDMGVYFNQLSLRNASASGSSTLNVQILDTRSQAAGTGPLKDNPYWGFAFTLGGVAKAVLSPAIDTALTYTDMVTAINAELAALRAGTSTHVTGVGSGGVADTSLSTVTATLGATFTAYDTVTGTAVTGNTITLTDSSGATIAANPSAGWQTQNGLVPASSGLHTNISNVIASVTQELVTSKVILDDVGMGSTGGDLVIGGMSVGETSTSRGVERFEIEVRDNSRLQTINGTNNALREVTIVNGVTSNVNNSTSTATAADNAYRTTGLNSGDLTVNGNVNMSSTGNGDITSNGANGTGTRQGLGSDTILKGVNSSNTINGYTADHHGAFGFTDVRLIDASAMTGKLAFTALISQDSIAKYVNLVDTAASPTADVANIGANTVNSNFNVKGANFIYTGGANDDTMAVTIDSAVASSRSTHVSGQSDFTFNVNGGAGNDIITVTVVDTLKGGAQHWYNNQKLNANITIDAGAGDDTIRTPGAGDVIIIAGDGNDTVYTDNTGAFGTVSNASLAGLSALAYSNAATAELAAVQAAVVASNTTGFKLVDGTTTGQAVTATAVAAALDILNLITPVTYAAVATAGAAPADAAPTYAQIQTGIDNAVAAGALTLSEAIALASAYQTMTTAQVVTPAATMVAQAITGGVAHAGGQVSAADFAAGNTLLATYIATAKANAAAATSNDTFAPVETALLDATQLAVVNATQAVNAVYDPTLGAVSAGTTESSTVTWNAFTGAGTQTIGGMTITATGAFTNAQVATVAGGGAVAGLTITTAPTAWTVGAAVGATNVFTSTTANTNVADVNLVTGATGASTETSVATWTAFVAAGTQTIGGMTITATGAFTNLQVAQIAGGGAAIAGLTSTAASGWTVATAVGATNVFTSTTPGTNVSNLELTAAFTGAGNAIPTAMTTNGGVANTAPVSGAITQGAVPVGAGTQTNVNNLAALATVFTATATDAQIVTALQAAIANGSITVAQAGSGAGTLFGAATTDGVPGSMTAADIAATMAILTPLQTTAANLNTTAQATLTAAIAANNTVVNNASVAVGLAPAGTAGNTWNGVANDNAGTAGTAAAVTAATAALNAANAVATTGLTAATAIVSNLASLKSTLIAGVTDLVTVTTTANAVANGTISAAQKGFIDAAASAVTGTVGVPMTAGEKISVDYLITGYQLTAETNLANATLVSANLGTTVTATTLAANIATAAAASGATSLTVSAPKAVFVLNTADQTAGYTTSTNDVRNLSDLKSDANNSYNFFNSTVKVTFKDISVSKVVAGTNYTTTDLQINQAIKEAINTDATLSKLLVATDGPANTLVVTSLIDGVMTTSNLAVTVTAPTSITTADATGATAVYGSAATQATLVTNVASFTTKGDYTTQFAETGAAGGNAKTVGANSLSSSDNTITPGLGNDVIVLGTTVGTDAMTSSNETVVYTSGLFGNDVIVNFAVSGLGIDQLNFSALNGRGNVAFGSLSLDKSIVVQAEAATPLTTTQIAALFTDSATAINHVYVAYNTTNIGSVYTVADAAGTGAGNVTATLVGTIDLADSFWSTLTAANFV